MGKLSCIVLPLLLCANLLSSGVAHAGVNRKDALELIRSIKANFDRGTVQLWINDKQSDHGVKVGDALSYTIATNRSQYYLMILVDPKGSTSVVFPDLLLNRNPKSYRQFTYPPANTGVLTQGEPVGTETVFAIAMDQPLTSSQLGFDGESDIQSLGNDQNLIKNFVNAFNMRVAGAAVDIIRLQYTVEADVQIDSRAFRRELAARVQQVNVLEDSKPERGGDSVGEPAIESQPLAVSDITFETDSDILTGIGRTQLDVFGNELINLWENGDLPHIILEGHTDDRGSDAYNLTLSQRRSEAAKQYLIDEYGLPAHSIATRGMGESKPVASNDTEPSRSENRRVEIRVVR